ncbi:right-handed parallel beta-helix repeat-containing protein [Cellulomonas fengjieae]|uniref:right-handed parallel beta-helix repeat-containing protein n=1 Tax=Cellulomonas fengjieae TaxID=2819978 RepID=UPI001AAF2A91|nr:right-handed parallel beta-helix repeat-containing protein [Cellulomonas fengjieae]MBO3100533.1 right-handed parallel beta-helix repeat-containing protein [Cellulomonas fengjieae]
MTLTISTGTRRRWRRAAPIVVVASAFAAGIAVAPAVLADPPVYSPVATLVSDTFSRTTASGWGVATSGQAWTSSAPGASSTSSGAGHIALAPGRNVTLAVPSVTATDTRVAVAVAATSAPTAGNGAFTSLDVRAQDGKSYRATLRLGRSGTATLHLVRRNGGGSETTLVAERALPFTVAAKQKVAFELQATGSTSVDVWARAWPVGTATPAWRAKATDSSAQRLATGSIAVRGYLSSASSALTTDVDDLVVSRLALSGPSTTPTPTASATPKPTPTPTPTVKPTPSPTATAAPGPAPTAAPSPTATPTATAAPAPAPQPSQPATSAVGSAPVGSTSYAVPAGAIFAAPLGTTGGSGTAASPYGSAQTAIDRAPTGSTIVLRAGVYHESVFVPQRKKLVIQSYPKEAVWFDGSSRVTGWVRSGSTWYVDGWNYAFDHTVSYIRGADDSSRFVDPAYPMAGYPDQVWIDGAPLAQVGSAGAVRPGTFFVDRGAKRLVIGSDPNGHAVDASTLVKGVQIQGEGTTVRGLGIRRYANHLSAFGAISAEMPNITLENLVVEDNATIGVFAWADGHTFRNITAVDNGLLGLGANTSDGSTITASVFSRNNTERFNREPSSGGIKISESDDFSVTDSLFDSNTTNGLWFDVYNLRTTIARNTFSNNGSDGLMYEISEGALIAGNHFVNNGRAGIDIIDSGSVSVWNNTLVGNGQWAVRLFQDERTWPDPAFPLQIRSIRFQNNVIAFPPGATCPLLVQDTTQTRYAKNMNLAFDTNLYHRTGPTSPANVACLANGSAAFQTYKSLAAMTAGHGYDRSSVLLEGPAVVDSAFAVTAAAKAAVRPAGVPADVAAALRVSPGWNGAIGAITTVKK